MDTGHSMKLNSTCRLDRAAGYEDCMAKEANTGVITSQNVQQGRWDGGGHAKPNTAACAQTEVGFII
jgi:hypothetical protein